jgi:AcrR family transcriptional regulator
MLIYNFGTRDELLREILGQARQRQLEVFTDLLRVRPDEPYPTTRSDAWSAMTGHTASPTCETQETEATEAVRIGSQYRRRSRYRRLVLRRRPTSPPLTTPSTPLSMSRSAARLRLR